MYYFNIAHLLKPSETSVLPRLRVSVDFRVIKCGFQEKVSWDTDPSCQPKVFGDLRQWRVVVLKEVRLRPVCWSLLIGWGEKKPNYPQSRDKTRESLSKLCSAVWHIPSSTPPRMWISEDSFWNNRSRHWREPLWVWAKHRGMEVV